MKRFALTYSKSTRESSSTTYWTDNQENLMVELARVMYGGYYDEFHIKDYAIQDRNP